MASCLISSSLTLFSSLTHSFDCCHVLCAASEFIRLCGFGNAIGLLAEKGLPGFTGLTQQAVSLDALMAARENNS